MLLTSVLLLLTSIFTSQITSSVIKGPGPFNYLSEDLLRHISGFSDNPYIIRSINKATNRAIPSAQAVIANRFGSELLNLLSSSPELWHLLKFTGKLYDFLKDSNRFLPQSFPLIVEVITWKLLDGSLILSQNNMNNYYKIIEENKLTHLIPRDSPIHPADSVNEENLHVLILRNLLLPIDQQISEIERIQTTPIDLFIALLETIKRVSEQEGIFQRLKQLIYSLSEKLNSSDYADILTALLDLKFNSFSVDSFYFTSFFADHYENKLWRDYFALVAIEVLRIDVLRMALFPIKGPVAQEIQDALLKNPEILVKFSAESAKLMFNSKEFLDYRIIAEDYNFDLKTRTITKDDVIVSGYKHEPERFRQVISRFSWIDFRSVSQLLACFLQDFRLIHNLIVISEVLETLDDFPELVLPEISFPVLEFIIYNHESFVGLLGNPFEYFRIIVSPKVMAAVLRDNQLYRIIKHNPQIFFNRFYFSFIDSIPLFTEFDWNRLFVLSSVPFNFNIMGSSVSLRTALSPLSCISLSYSLDLIKLNMVDWIMLETSIEKLRSSLEHYLLFSPLLSIWAKNDVDSYIKYFHSIKHKLIQN